MKFNPVFCVNCELLIEQPEQDNPNLHKTCEEQYLELLDIESSMIKNIENIFGVEIPILYDTERRDTTYFNFIVKSSRTKFVTVITLFNVDIVRHLHNRPNYVPQAGDEDDLEDDFYAEEEEEELAETIDQDHIHDVHGNIVPLKHKKLNYAQIIDYISHFTRLESLFLNIMGDVSPNTFRFKKFRYLRKVGLQSTNILVPAEDSLPGTLQELSLIAEHEDIMKDLFNKITPDSPIERVDITHCKLEKLPDIVTKLENLHELVINDCGLKELPETIGNLTNLKILNLADNDITELPGSFKQLQKLEKVDLTNNDLQDFEIVTYLPELTEIKLLGNEIYTIPDNIVTMKKLEFFYCGNNISQLPEFTQGRPPLRGLVLEINAEQAEKILDIISSITTIEQLSVVSQDYIPTLPQSFSRLQNLIALHLKMKRKDIPDYIVELPQIQKISLEKIKVFDGENYRVKEIYYAIESVDEI